MLPVPVLCAALTLGAPPIESLKNFADTVRVAAKPTSLLSASLNLTEAARAQALEATAGITLPSLALPSIANVTRGLDVDAFNAKAAAGLTGLGLPATVSFTNITKVADIDELKAKAGAALSGLSLPSIELGNRSLGASSVIPRAAATFLR